MNRNYDSPFQVNKNLTCNNNEIIHNKVKQEESKESIKEFLNKITNTTKKHNIKENSRYENTLENPITKVYKRPARIYHKKKPKPQEEFDYYW